MYRDNGPYTERLVYMYREDYPERMVHELKAWPLYREIMVHA